MSVIDVKVASDALTKIPVVVSGNPVTVHVDILEILSNVVVYVKCDYDDGSYLDSELITKESALVHYSATFQRSGTLRIVTILKPRFHNKIEDNPFKIEYYFGRHDGTGEDFLGDDAATVHFHLTHSSRENSYDPYTGPYEIIKTGYMLNNRHDLVVSIIDSHFENKALEYNHLMFHVESDPNHIRMLEDNVWLHLYNGHNELIGISRVERDSQNPPSVHNKSINYNYPAHGGDFKVVALIVPRVDPGAPNTKIYEIGDPKVNAKVTISQS